MSLSDSPTSIPEVRLVVVGGAAQSAKEAVAPVFNLRTQRIEQFLGTRNPSNTKRNYERQLRYFMDWADKDWHIVTLNDLKNYKEHLVEKGLGLGSVGAYLTSIKSLFGNVLNLWNWKIMVRKSEVILPNGGRTCSLSNLPKY